MKADRPTAKIAALVEAYHETGDRRLRNEVVEMHLDIADYYVRRYSRRGVAPDDLRQVALLTIVRAVDRFDTSQGVEFATFAGRSIDGELKRYFRDRTWMVRPPRPAQELHLNLRAAEDELTQRLGRSPTVAELADHVGDSVDHVLEAMEVRTAHSPASLDRKRRGDEDDGATLADVVLSYHEVGYRHVEMQTIIADLMATLDDRDRRIIQLRFFENRSQEEIAAEIGVSQSYLSRILRRVLDDLREGLAAGPADATD